MSGVNHTEGGNDASRLAQINNVQFTAAPKLCNVLIREAHLLCFKKKLLIVLVLCESRFHSGDFLEGLKEVCGDLGDLLDLVYRVTAAEQLADSESVIVVELLNVGEYFLVALLVELRHMKVANADLKRANRLKETFLKVRSDTHRLTGSLHLRAELVGNRGELIEGESRELRYDVVKIRLKGSLSSRNIDLVKSHTEGDLRGNSCDGITRRLGCKSGGTGNSGVDLDEVIFRGIGV